MLTQIENKKGLISFDDSLIEQIINESLKEFHGSYKLIRMNFGMQSDGMYVYIELRLKFGTSINDFSTKLLTNIGEMIENNLELPVYKIKLFISGVYSRKIAKRNILFEYNNKSEIEHHGY